MAMTTRGAAAKQAKEQSFLQRFFGGQEEGGDSSSKASSVGSVMSSTKSKQLTAEVNFMDRVHAKNQEKCQLELEENDVEADIYEKQDRVKYVERSLKKLDPSDPKVEEFEEECLQLQSDIKRLSTKLKRIQIKLNKVKEDIALLPAEKKLTQDLLEEIDEQQISDNEGSIEDKDRGVDKTDQWVEKHSEIPTNKEVSPTPSFQNLVQRFKNLKGDASHCQDKDQPIPSPHPEDKESLSTENMANGENSDTSNRQVLQQLAQSQTMMVQLLQQQQNGSTGTEKFIARQSIGKDLPWFFGKAEEWPAFITEYERTTKICNFSSDENMQRLRKCLKGEAAKAVQCLMVSPDNLEDVMNTLKMRFGQTKHIIQSMLKEARSVSPVKEDKPHTLVEFGTRVMNLVSTIKSLKAHDHLNNPILLEELEMKLPSNFRLQWVEWVDTEKAKKDLESFTAWLKRKVRFACEISTPYVRDDRKDDKKEEQHHRNQQWNRRRDVNVHAISEHQTEELMKLEDAQGKAKVKSCQFCNGKDHKTTQCPTLCELSADERIMKVAEKKLCFGCLNAGHTTAVCQSKKACGRNGCKFQHHPLLHGAKPIQELLQRNRHTQNSPNPAQVHHVNATSLRYVQVEVSGPLGNEIVLALEDDGANITMAEEEVAATIGARGPIIPFCMATINGDGHHPQSMNVSMGITSAVDKSSQFKINNVKTVKELNLQSVTLDAEMLKSRFPYLKNLPLKSFYNTKPKMLIGSSHFDLISHLRVVQGDPGEPIAVKSRLGWSVIFPEVHGPEPNISAFKCHHVCAEYTEDSLHQLVKKSFAVEDFGVKIVEERPRSKEDQRAMKIMESTTVRAKDEKRFETGLLWKSEDVQLPESKTMAINRLRCQERKMDKDAAFAQAYCTKIQEYLEKGFIRKLNPEEVQVPNPRTWYLPHFGVMNPNKPKLRLVFDAAAKSHGVSLNDYLCQGPDLNNPLVSVLMKFRQFKYAFVGDIKDMFHRVFVREEDRMAQRFLWRGMNREQQPDVYEMIVMIFGATSSPSCAQYAKNLNATENAEAYPEATKAITTKFYVDDYLDSKPTEEEAIKLIQEVISVQAKAGFEVCNWVANSRKIIKSIKEAQRSKDLKEVNLDDSELPEGRVLGLWWDPSQDVFRYKLNFHKVPTQITDGSQRPTKRQVLRLVMSVFDPLGFLGHLIVKAKILMQDIWRSEIGWDDEVPESLNEKWQVWLQELQGIVNVRIPRCYSFLIPKSKSTQLHIFCDASEKAFVAIAFLRIELDTDVDVNIVMARTRVSPLKPMSIPRLELQAAVMGARMAKTIRQELEIKIDRLVMWTDSFTVIRWIRNDARRFKQFVSHRLGEILEVTEVADWRWIPTKLNIADDATRDNIPADLTATSRWFNGEKFLMEDESEWPQEKDGGLENPLAAAELKVEVNLMIELPAVIDISRFSRFNRILRTTAWMLRFMKNLANPKGAKAEKKIRDELMVYELKLAEVELIKIAQRDSFREELQLVHGGKQLPKHSALYTLKPYFDEVGVLRMKSRLQNAECLGNEVKNPVILSWKHHLTKLIVSNQHELSGHQGRGTVASELRQKYWIVGLTAAVKEAFAKCQVCKNRKAQPDLPEMADLPESRLRSHVRPFTNTGLDYFGPIEVVVGRRREKRWVALFTCMSTRAVHLEIATSLSTDSAINAIRRFRCRRGTPKNIYSDNGTNFHGANNELRKALANLDQEKLSQTCSTMRIQWTFNPPASPHMGGVWERMVGSVKKVLSSMMEDQAYNEEIMHTFIVEAENIVNKRPLTDVSVDPADPAVLTPNHFLLGWNHGTVAESEEDDDKPWGEFDRSDLFKKSWRSAQQLADEFWRKWVKDYLPTLTRRSKWYQPCKPVSVDDIVVVVDDQAKRNNWEKGRVVAIHPGRDGKVRVADVKTSRGIYRRPVAKLAVLDIK